DHPERALRELSANAHLVVIGARGRSRGLELGQVSRRIVMAALCPVMVVGSDVRPRTSSDSVGAAD
ncbi:universal stress protein, partial [Pseudonocardia sp. D17]